MEPIVLNIRILKPVEKVWDLYTKPEHITKWNVQSGEWNCPKVDVDFREGGHFRFTMLLKKFKFSYDIAGTYSRIDMHRHITMAMEDGREVNVDFQPLDAATTDITYSFMPRKGLSWRTQRENWYNILDNFHKYAERQK